MFIFVIGTWAKT